VKVVSHEAIRVHLPPGFLAPLGQSFEKVLPINVINENVLPPIPSVHDVVNCARIFDSHRARHARKVTN